MTPEEFHNVVRDFANANADADCLVSDEHGTPLGVFRMDQIESDGVDFAFALAAVSGDDVAITSVVAETLNRVGSSAFGYVAASALKIMTTEILEPALVVTDTVGIDLRSGLRRIAAGEDPGGE
jgi:hypothetical protein